MDPISAILYLVLAAAKTIPKPSWPDESAVGVNLGISPARSGFSGFYAQGANQWNLGLLYSIGSEAAGHTNVRTGLTYNRQLTDWGLFAAAGLNVTYIIELGESRYDDDSQFDPEELPAEGAAWRSHGIAYPEFIVTIGEALWFGENKWLGLNVDAGIAQPFGYGMSHNPYPIVGAGVSYRFTMN
jgi:hypothetical protein